MKQYIVMCTPRERVEHIEPYSGVLYEDPEGANEEAYDARHNAEITGAWVEEYGGRCGHCKYWACMNVKDLIGACTIWHDSGITWPKAEESCDHWERRKEDGKEES